MPLPIAPMLSRTGELPTGDGWSCEVKFDGFRALVSTVDGLKVCSRRGWNMTEALPELRGIPKGLVLDGELVAFNKVGDPNFPLLSKRILNRDTSVPIQFMIFDVLAADGESITSWSYARRRDRLERLGLDGPAWITPDTFDDGGALYAASVSVGSRAWCEVAACHYRPGKRAGSR